MGEMTSGNPIDINLNVKSPNLTHFMLLHSNIRIKYKKKISLFTRRDLKHSIGSSYDKVDTRR